MSKSIYNKFLNDYFLDENKKSNFLTKKNMFETFLSRLEGTFAEKKIIPSSPLRVGWAFIGDCNLNCAHCFSDTRDKFIASEKELFNFIDEFRKMGGHNLTFTGGEPFLYDKFLFLVEYAKKRNFCVDILTNGTLISTKIAQKLKSLLHPETDLIQISLDGPNSEINDTIRSKGSFTKIIEGICNCRDAGVKFSVNTTLCDINVDYLCEMYKLVSMFSGAYAYTFFTLMSAGRGKDMQFNNVERGIEEAIKLKYLEKQIKGPRVSGFVGYIQHLNGYVEAMGEIFGSNPIVIDRNSVARSNMDINANGDAYPCAYFQVPEMRGGNVRKRSLKEIWRTPKWKVLRNGWPLSHTKCAYCDRAEYCNRGNMAIAYQRLGRVDYPDPQCKYIPPMPQGIRG